MSRAEYRVDVIIVNWSGKEFLAGCLKSLSNQKFQDFLVTVVDNNSDDGSRRFVRNYYPEVKLIELDKNYGFAYPNNVGIEKTGGEYVVLLNNDTIVGSNWLKELVEFMDYREKVGFAASKVLLSSEGNRIDTAGDYYSIAGSAGKLGHLDEGTKKNYRRKKRVFGASAGAAIYRRSMLEDVGLFDEDFFIVQEDVDLSYRARLRGYDCFYVPEARVIHHSHGSIGEESSMYVYFSHRNLEYVYFKNTPLLLILLTFPFHVADSLLSLLYYLYKGKVTDFLRAKYDALSNLRMVLAKRREVQRSRKIRTDELFFLFRKDWPLNKLRLFARKIHRGLLNTNFFS